MPGLATHLGSLSSRDAAGAITRAADALTRSALAVFPTETVYGIGANVSTLEGLARLRALTPGAPADAGGGPRPGTWHAPSRQAVVAAVPLKSPLHRRAVETLMPGPVRLHVELSAGEIREFLSRIGAAPGTVERSIPGGGVAISVRVPDHDIAAAVLAEAKCPVVVERLSALGWGDDPSTTTFQTRAGAAGIEHVLYDGRPRIGRPSSVVRLAADGSVAVVEENAMSARVIQKRLQRSVLFVCTGNTCRSPIAEAAARHLLATEFRPAPGDVPISVGSAGTGATEGDRATPEGIESLRSMGIESNNHRAREATRALLDGAEIIYAMTRSHAQALARIAPHLADRVQLLDPAGVNVPDPIGASQEVYDKVGRRIVELVRARLAELLGRGA